MDSKPWYESLTIWGIVVMGFMGLMLPLIGKADYAAFFEAEKAGIIEWLGALGTVIGGLMAFIGRLRAVTKIK